jgi:hypothetical protein
MADFDPWIRGARWWFPVFFLKKQQEHCHIIQEVETCKGLQGCDYIKTKGLCSTKTITF